VAGDCCALAATDNDASKAMDNEATWRMEGSLGFSLNPYVLRPCTEPGRVGPVGPKVRFREIEETCLRHDRGDTPRL